MSTEGHQRDFIISNHRDGYAASRGYSTINSNLPVPGSHVISTRANNIIKVPALLSNKNANHTVQNDFMAVRNSRNSKKDFEEGGRSSALTAHGQLAGGIRMKTEYVITRGEQLKVQQAKIKQVFDSGNF